MDRPSVDVDRFHVAMLVLATAAGIVALLVSSRIFPYHSLNHDEGVYLQQAQLLLDGRLYLRPPVEDAFRPWFFVEDGDRLYSKYAPLTAAVFAVGKLLGGFPLALAAIAAAVVGLTVTLGRELFDGRTGLLAGVLLLASPLFLVQSGVYLSYALTTALNLVFAIAYVRGERRASLAAAAVAGGAIGLAFFARPYTAVLFAIPFIAHAGWTLAQSKAWRIIVGSVDDDHALLARRLATAGFGIAGVVIALGYNWFVTGDLLVFPYQAFAPHDGIGFGYRKILGHEENYTVALALRANSQILWRLFTDWVVAGPVGTALAAVGVFTAIRNRDAGATPYRVVLAGLFLTVPIGNLAFWGNLNALGRLEVVGDGLVHYLGPYYHFDLLVPTTLFAAYGIVVGVDQLRTGLYDRLSVDDARRMTVAVLLVSSAAFSGVAVATAEEPLARNNRVSEELEANYEPFADGSPPDSVVFLPEPYGPWLNHPFQALRNDHSYDGRTIYALGGDTALAVAAEYPNRTLYRYVYRGTWPPTDDQTVTASLQKLEQVEGDTVRLDASMMLPANAKTVTVRLSTAEGSAYYVANATADDLNVTVTVADGQVKLTGPNVSQTGTASVPIENGDEVTMTAYVSTGPASGFSYRIALPIDRTNGTVRALSPTRERCQVPTRCTPVGVGAPTNSTGIKTTLITGTE